MPCIDDDLFGVTAAGQERTDLVADFPSLDRVAAGRDDAGDFQPGMSAATPAGGGW